MNIQDFATQLEQQTSPSPLQGALRALQSSDLQQFRGPGAMGPEWAPWADDEPRVYAQRPELRS
jgi:hypothetical protein